MRLTEFYDPEQDRSSQFGKDDTRKTKLTLIVLNKLRKLRDLNAAEESAYGEFAKVMYGPQPDQDDSGMM